MKPLSSVPLSNSQLGSSGIWRWLGLLLGMLGLFLLLLNSFRFTLVNFEGNIYIILLMILSGITFYSFGKYSFKPAGIQNDGVWFKSITSRGWISWLIGVVLTAFYVILYFYPHLLGLGKIGGSNTGLVALFDPFSYLLKGQPASEWFVYGVLYTVAIVGFGIKFILKYRNNRYQVARTISVMFFQLAFAFWLPTLMERLNYPDYDLKSVWPLNYYLFADWKINGFLNAGNIGVMMLLFGIISILIITPILTYLYGKRWYCSWVCGCGGLAETAGDSFRQLSNKSVKVWKFERWSIHIVLVFVVLMTVAVVYSFLGRKANVWISKDLFLYGVIGILSAVILILFIYRRKSFDKDVRFTALSLFIIIVGILLINHSSDAKRILFFSPYKIQSAYGFLIGAVFSGVIGTGFYPILGSRVWCRFGCPMAAILGIQQRLFSRFRITTNGGQCISCGNCSTYCEMGIDVRSYAQKGENVVRASCVGCGICAAVCPRGVLKLENGKSQGRINSDAVLLGNDPNLMELLKNS